MYSHHFAYCTRMNTVDRETICVYFQAGTVRDSMAKSLYSALFDWIVFRINHALLNIKDLEETTKVAQHPHISFLQMERILSSLMNFSKQAFSKIC